MLSPTISDSKWSNGRYHRHFWTYVLHHWTAPEAVTKNQISRLKLCYLFCGYIRLSDRATSPLRLVSWISPQIQPFCLSLPSPFCPVVEPKIDHVPTKFKKKIHEFVRSWNDPWKIYEIWQDIRKSLLFRPLLSRPISDHPYPLPIWRICSFLIKRGSQYNPV